jgi:hypothetical protein
LIEQGLGRTVDVLRAAGKDVTLFAGVPELPFLPKDCIGRPGASLFARDCLLSRPAADARRARFVALLQRVAAARPGVRIFDPASLFCDASRCRFDTPDSLYYRDWHHLSVAGSHLAAAALLDGLRERGQEVSSTGR